MRIEAARALLARIPGWPAVREVWHDLVEALGLGAAVGLISRFVLGSSERTAWTVAIVTGSLVEVFALIALVLRIRLMRRSARC